MYTELQTTTNFSFLRDASHVEELFARAAMLRYPALGITDRNGLAGIVRAHESAKETGVRLIVGCRLDLTDGPSVLVYPTDRAAYARLTRLLTLGKRRAGKGKCELRWPDLTAAAQGLIGILATDPDEDNLRQPVRPAVRGRRTRRGFSAAQHPRRRGQAWRRAGPAGEGGAGNQGPDAGFSLSGGVSGRAVARVKRHFPARARAKPAMTRWDMTAFRHPIANRHSYACIAIRIAGMPSGSSR
jgi:hypothetical protein